MVSTRAAAPVLPVAISQSPLLSGGLLPLPDDLFATLAGPLPTITIGPCPPSSPSARLGAGRLGAPRPPSKPRSKPSSPRIPSAPIQPKHVASLFELLESMELDMASEVRRVRLGIHEARLLVQACREDSTARETARQRKLERERERDENLQGY
ncbi:hypothetical protein L227DRAFT_572350 [Lentinus tigrinus ALCF2SS1-6]|uniref:Uncharacterized protein n=1 Tax=Lentinus tigrinus ALCF2SS1-6 TaxID=1328759 RepID=A0A5C2SKV8_9APHY|nr:hypothetical protein L227DRAFT_572350 [Lentinus tigrinus ALCF2SS1-6]